MLAREMDLVIPALPAKAWLIIAGLIGLAAIVALSVRLARKRR
jgi:hypothetical protein